MIHEDQQERVGPRGGTTTMTKSGMVRKNFWLPVDEAEDLRLKAFQERTGDPWLVKYLHE